MRIFDLGGNPGLARELADALHMPLMPIYKRQFPNQETYIRLPDDLRGEDVILVTTAYPHPNERIIELLLAADCAKRAGASRVSAVVPYMAYGRQDRIQIPGEPVSSLTLANALKAAGVDSLYVADFHNPLLLQSFPLASLNVMTASLLGSYVKERYSLNDPLVLIPGAKSLDDQTLIRAKLAAQALGSQTYTAYLKRRDPHTGELFTETRPLGVKGRDVLIIDDEISTGMTVLNAIKALNEEEVGDIIVACTHGVFADEAAEKIASLGTKDIISTDSIPNAYSRVRLAQTFASSIKAVID